RDEQQQRRNFEWQRGLPIELLSNFLSISRNISGSGPGHVPRVRNLRLRTLGRTICGLSWIQREIKRKSQQQRDDHCRCALSRVKLDLRFLFGARLYEHYHKQKQNHHAANIDKDLDARYKLGAKQYEHQCYVYE